MPSARRQRPRDLLLEAFRMSRNTSLDEATVLIDKALNMIDAADQDDFLAYLMTEAEHRAMDLTAQLWNLISQEIVHDGPSRDGDLAELASDIHRIQERLLAQAGARAFPARYRTLGSAIITTKGLT